MFLKFCSVTVCLILFNCPVLFGYWVHQTLPKKRVPKNPTIETNTKSFGWHVAKIWPFEVYQKWPRAAILDLTQLNQKWRCSIRRPRKPHLEPNMMGIGWHITELWPFEIFAKCVNGTWGQSSVGQSSVCQSVGRLVGRSSIFILLT